MYISHIHVYGYGTNLQPIIYLTISANFEFVDSEEKYLFIWSC